MQSPGRLRLAERTFSFVTPGVARQFEQATALGQAAIPLPSPSLAPVLWRPVNDFAGIRLAKSDSDTQLLPRLVGSVATAEDS
jgi:hypothetical protein